MKKLFLLPTVLLLALFVPAQTLLTAKNMAILGQFRQGRAELDKGMANGTFASIPEAYMLKTSIYAALAMDAGIKGTSEADQLITTADAAFSKYQEMEPSLSLLTDPVYANGPINVYTALYTSGYSDYQQKNWQTACQKLKRVVAYSDILISRKLVNIAADTNALILAGITAENAGLKDDAARYYSRLADMKIGTADYESVYRFLVSYAFTKRDMASFEKYKSYGKELFPSSNYFDFDKVDFAVGLETDLFKKLKALDDILAADPENVKAQEVTGELIYDTLDSRVAGAVPPANAAELEKKMVNAFNKSAALTPANELPLLYIGNHFINVSAKIDNKKDKAYLTALENAMVPYEKAAALYAKKEGLSKQDKQQYKNVVSYLSEIYGFRKTVAGVSEPDKVKFAAAEKKWNDVYDSIK